MYKSKGCVHTTCLLSEALEHNTLHLRLQEKLETVATSQKRSVNGSAELLIETNRRRFHTISPSRVNSRAPPWLHYGQCVFSCGEIPLQQLDPEAIASIKGVEIKGCLSRLAIL